MGRIDLRTRCKKITWETFSNSDGLKLSNGLEHGNIDNSETLREDYVAALIIDLVWYGSSGHG
jgi:hypothetical protein